MVLAGMRKEATGAYYKILFRHLCSGVVRTAGARHDFQVIASK
jgi:hypothetical protein